MSRFWSTMARLHRDEQGAEKVEYLLILAAVALPLLGVLIYYRNELSDWIGTIWTTAKGNADSGGLPGQ